MAPIKRKDVGTAPKPGADGWVELLNGGGVKVRIPKEDLAYVLKKHPEMKLLEAHHAPKTIKQIKAKFRMSELKEMLAKVPDIEVPEFATHDGLAALYLESIGEGG